MPSFWHIVIQNVSHRVHHIVFVPFEFCVRSDWSEILWRVCALAYVFSVREHSTSFASLCSVFANCSDRFFPLCAFSLASNNHNTQTHNHYSVECRYIICRYPSEISGPIVERKTSHSTTTTTTPTIIVRVLLYSESSFGGAGSHIIADSLWPSRMPVKCPMAAVSDAFGKSCGSKYDCSIATLILVLFLRACLSAVRP